MNTWLTTAASLERAIQREISTFTKDLWKEDAITIAVVKQIRNVLANTTIEGDPVKSKVLARAYKADGKVEERFGDLAIVVKVTFRDGEQLEGVAFYEAKRRDWDKNTLPAAKKGQLNQMHRALWHGHLLIFDRTQSVVRETQFLHIARWLQHGPYHVSFSGVTQAIAVPLGPVLQVNRLDTSLHKLGAAFSSQVVLRNLQGFDLDTEKATLATAKGYGKRMDVCPYTVVTVGIGEGPYEPELPDVNEKLLKTLEQSSEGRGD